MRVVITGGAGFIGRAIVERLARRGDDVVALVRDTGRARYLKHDEQVELVTSDLSSIAQLTAQMKKADAVIHAAGMYRIGIQRSERDAMWDANVGATGRVLDAAVAAGAKRIVYVSTANVFGNTRGESPNETFRRDEKLGFLSYYDETKYRAHQAALERIAAGGPIVVVMPSQVYGPHDHSDASAQIDLAYRGRLRYVAFPDTGLAWVHVDDLADGIVAALDRGRIGESYVMSGDPRRMQQVVEIAARLAGRKPPRLSMPVRVIRGVAPVNDRLGGLPGFPGNLREVIRSAQDVTYWANHDKATTELDFHPRSLEQGIADTWGPGAAKKRSRA
ncbi:MAG TPA: NAD-dependent epimerase/dehydratase family protein [Candidatus Limnocylindrales bacterium]|nr:NAD-dependent epimerase/dehydratase family protein [Candidatus Limnocylindrales bacterium]